MSQRGRKGGEEEMDEEEKRKGKGETKKCEGRKTVKWDKQTGSHPESWKQTGKGGRVQ